MCAAVLRFLADESCDFAIVRDLRAQGYDVLAISKATQLCRYHHRPCHKHGDIPFCVV